MALEQFANNAETTLSAAIETTDGTSISVTAYALFPAAAQFRVRIDDELLLVTDGAGTTTWTVERGAESTTAATHASGATVTRPIECSRRSTWQRPPAVFHSINTASRVYITSVDGTP